MSIAIILVKPQMGENIGAAARAMKNFGLSDLRIVAPRDGWPNEQAIATSTKGVDIIEAAKIYQDLPSALVDLQLIYATAAAGRNIAKSVIQLPALTKHIKTHQASKIGIIFGRESSGLTNSEIALAHELLTIPTDSAYSSLNLGQAVMLVAYELSKIANFDLQVTADINNPLATSQQLNYFLNYLLDNLQAAGYFKTDNADNADHKIRNIFSRVKRLTAKELQMLHGIIKTLINNK